jgi:hypothetical protein
MTYRDNRVKGSQVPEVLLGQEETLTVTPASRYYKQVHETFL